MPRPDLTSTRFFISPPQSAHRARALLEHCAVGYQRSSKLAVRPHAVVPDAPAEHFTNCFPESWELLHPVDLGPVGLASSAMSRQKATPTHLAAHSHCAVDAAIGRHVEPGKWSLMADQPSPISGERALPEVKSM